MNGSRSKSRCSSSSFALTLRLIALRCLNDRSSWISRSLSPFTIERIFSTTHPDFGVLRRRKIVEKLHQLADQVERARHELAGICESNHFAVGIELREEETIGEHLREGVGELAEPEFVKDLIAENLIKAVKAAFRVLFFLPPQ